MGQEKDDMELYREAEKVLSDRLDSIESTREEIYERIATELEREYKNELYNYPFTSNVNIRAEEDFEDSSWKWISVTVMPNEEEPETIEDEINREKEIREELRPLISEMEHKSGVEVMSYILWR